MAADTKNNTEEQELYYKNKILGFLRGSASRSTYIKYQMQRCYDYFGGLNTNNPYKSLTDVFNLSKQGKQGAQILKLPTIFTDLNHIAPKAKALEGELIGMGFKVHVESINREAKSRKLEMKLKAMTDMAMKPYFDHAAVETGIEIGIEDDVPTSKKELEERFKNKNYKDISDMAMTACLKYSIQYWEYIVMRLQLFLDVVVAGECHAESRVVNGFPQLERWNPINTFYTINPNDDDFLSRTNAKGLVGYSDINEVMNQYDLTSEQIEKLKDLTIATGGIEPYLGVIYNNIRFFEPFQDDKKLILVARWKWTDAVEKLGVEITYADGRTEFRILNKEEVKTKGNRINKKELGIPDDANFKVKRKKVATIKKATLIGGQMCVDYGEEQFLIRDTENISMAICPIVSFRPYYKNGSSTSEVAQLMKIQDLRNYIMTMVTLEITKSGGNALAVDVSKLPKEWGASPVDKMGKVLHYLKGFGIIPYNSAEGEQLPGTNSIPVQRFDAGIGSALVSYVSIMQLLESEMDKISGINSARLGNVQSANQLNGVTEMAIQQASTITRYLHFGFFHFESKLLTCHCQHIKMTWIYNPERFTDIIGDYYFEFLKQDVDITMDTHAATVQPDEISFETLKGYLALAVQANALPLDEALRLEVVGATDVREGVDEYIEEMRERREQQRQDNLQMQQSQQETQMQIAQGQQQAQQQMLEQQQAGDYKKQQLKSLTDFKKKQVDDANKRYIKQMEIMNDKARI